MADAATVELVLGHIHNWFVRERMGVKVVGGVLPASATDRMVEGQWYRIEGSYLNDGVHQHPADLEEESFEGTLSLLAIPKALMLVIDQIEAWIEDYEEARSLSADARRKALSSPYQSESFGGYTYTVRGDLTANSASDGLSGPNGWKQVFAADLNQWRKVS